MPGCPRSRRSGARGACAGRSMWIRSSCFERSGERRMPRHAPARGAVDVSCTLPRRPDFADLSPLKLELEQLLRASLAKLAGTVLPTPPAADAVVLERTREAQHGDFATNVALRLAKSARRNPRELAEAIVAALPASPLLERAEVAGAGFINFHLTTAAYARELATLHAQAGAYGESRLGRGERVLPPRAGGRVRREPARAGGAGAGGVRVSEPDRAAARGSRPAGRLRGHAREHPRRGGL